MELAPVWSSRESLTGRWHVWEKVHLIWDQRLTVLGEEPSTVGCGLSTTSGAWRALLTVTLGQTAGVNADSAGQSPVTSQLGPGTPDPSLCGSHGGHFTVLPERPFPWQRPSV